MNLSCAIRSGEVTLPIVFLGLMYISVTRLLCCPLTRVLSSAVWYLDKR